MIIFHSIFILFAILVAPSAALSANTTSILELKLNGKTVAKIEGFFVFKLANQEQLFIVPTSPVTVTGNQTPRTTNFVVKWTDGNGSSLIWRTNFLKNKGVVSLTNSSLQIDRADGSSANSSWEFKETLVENSSFSYVCSNLNMINGQHDAITMENVRLQPFDLQNETFGQGYFCAKDRTTTVAPTTPPTPKPKPTIGNWTVTQNDFSCIRLIADLRLKLAYKTADGANSTAVVQVPPNAQVVKSTSTCGYNVITATSEGDEQVIQLQFKIQSNDWFLTLNFTNNSILARIPIDQHPSLAYYARLDYITDAMTFVNVSKPNERITLQNVVNKTSGEGALSLFKSDTTHFYRCNSEEKTPVVEGFEIMTKSLRVEAFLNNSTTLMKERVCLTDQQNETSDLVPIITGAALAALVLFVLIAYLVGRARARANTYETI